MLASSVSDMIIAKNILSRTTVRKSFNGTSLNQNLFKKKFKKRLEICNRYFTKHVPVIKLKF